MLMRTGGRSTQFGTDPHCHLRVAVADIDDADTSHRERMWVIRRGEGDWHAFVAGPGGTGRTTYHYTSNDGKSWTLDPNNPVAGNDTYGTQDMCVFYDSDNSQYCLVAEDETDSTSSSGIWTATDLDADSWTHQANFSRKFGGDNYGTANPTPWYDSGTDTWYIYFEEYHSSGPEYVRAVSCDTDPSQPSNYTDEGRIISNPNFVPKGLWEDSNGNPRLYIKQRPDLRRWWYAQPSGGDLLNWEIVNQVYPAGPSSNGRDELMPAHDSNGYEEYKPNGTPWVYSWHLNSLGGDDRYDLLKGG